MASRDVRRRRCTTYTRKSSGEGLDQDFNSLDAQPEAFEAYIHRQKLEAMAAVPDELVDAVHLVGPKERIRDRLQAWKAEGQKGWIDTMIIGASQPEAYELVAEEML